MNRNGAVHDIIFYMIKKNIQIPGMLAISFDKRDNAFIQFVPDEPDSVEIDSILFEGSAQLLRSGQFEFISNKSNILKIR